MRCGETGVAIRRSSGVLVVKAPFFLELFCRPLVQYDGDSNAAKDDEYQRNDQHDEFRLVEEHVENFHKAPSRAGNWFINSTV